MGDTSRETPRWQVRKGRWQRGDCRRVNASDRSAIFRKLKDKSDQPLTNNEAGVFPGLDQSLQTAISRFR
jgi:hypothetical protein